jgi:hypothetical protein
MSEELELQYPADEKKGDTFAVSPHLAPNPGLVLSVIYCLP